MNWKCCQNPMDKPYGCSAYFVKSKERLYRRIPVGANYLQIDRKVWPKNKEEYTCPDCFVNWGELHHWDCEHEPCPVCLGQLVSCNCDESPIMSFGA